MCNNFISNAPEYYRIFNYKAVFILFLTILLGFMGCGPMRKLNKYRGQEIKSVIDDLGEPASVIPLSEGKIYIWEKSTTLKSTEIAKGQMTLDPMISPAVIKTEKTVFTTMDGKVVAVKKETEYTRK